MNYWPTVLLVEDNPDDALLFEHAVRRGSVPVSLQRVCNGDEAIRYLKGEGNFSDRDAHPMPGIAIIDLHMPGRSGLALLSWIRNQRWLTGLPVVVFSGSDFGKSVAEAMKNGADTYIVKGHETAGLVQLLENADLRWAETHRVREGARSTNLVRRESTPPS